MKDEGRDIVLLIAWILSILLVGTSLLYVTNKPRNRALIHSVNSVLAASGSEHRLKEETDNWGKKGRAALAGQRFSTESGRGTAVIKPLMSEGSFAVCIAFFNENGQLIDRLPLGSSSERILDRMNPLFADFYFTRMEELEKSFVSGDGR